MLQIFMSFCSNDLRVHCSMDSLMLVMLMLQSKESLASTYLQ